MICRVPAAWSINKPGARARDSRAVILDNAACALPSYGEANVSGLPVFSVHLSSKPPVALMLTLALFSSEDGKEYLSYTDAEQNCLLHLLTTVPTDHVKKRYNYINL